MKQRKNRPRGQAPQHIDLPSPATSPSTSATTSPSPASPVSALDSVLLRIPLLAHKLVGTGLGKGEEIDPQVNVYKDGRMKISAPKTPWEELDLSESFLHALHTAPIEPPKTFFQKRRMFFLGGALLGIFTGWLFTDGDQLMSLASNIDFPDQFPSFDMQSLLAELPSLSTFNTTTMLSPGREWLNSKSTNFAVGRDAVLRGQTKHHAVILVPGIVSSGLESWSTAPEAAPFFRKRIWASTSMLRAIVSSKETWVRAMTLDPETGLDAAGYKVRAAQGLDAASAFMPGYWIWGKIIENLAVLDYDHDDLFLASYDWRLSYYNLEVRDQYFSRLKAQIEFNLQISGKKTVIVAHSMGSLVVLWFFKWAEAEGYGNGGPQWVETHIASFTNIAGTLLGVPKAMSAILSGEMRDTVEINAAGVYLLEKLFSRSERANLFRSWAGAASMMLKGGNAVWGTHASAPDDKANATLSGGNIYCVELLGSTWRRLMFRCSHFRPESFSNSSDVTQQTTTPNLTMDDASTYILQHVPNTYERMLGTNFSFGIERSAEQLVLNNQDHRKWTNPLEMTLPLAPSMSIQCLYGVGRETERGYFYQQGGYERDEVGFAGSPLCTDAGCLTTTPRTPLDMPLSRRSWIDSSVTLESQEPKVRSGVVFGEGDGTVSLLSLGAMCVDGWKRDLYNPARIPIVTHEIKHEPLAFDPRGGPTTADHVDILGSSELNEAILDIVSGHEGRVREQLWSDIVDYAGKIKWDAE